MMNSEQDGAHSEAVPEKDQAVKKIKRSPIERAIVWGLIAVALAVILIEWNARSGYSNTLTAMQDRIRLADKDPAQEFSLVEAKTMVKGFPYGDEKLTKSGKQLQYRWLSLFRTYALQLSADDEDIVLSLKTEAEPMGEEPTQIAASRKKALQNKGSQIAAHQLSLPIKGLKSEQKNVVVLATDNLDSQVEELKGMLTREIVRQALLIGGRDGLGLRTRDASLRGEVQLVENSEFFPLQLITHIKADRQVSIELVWPLKTEYPFRWNSEPFTLPEEFGFEALIEQTEELSRTGFVEALKKAGFPGNTPVWKEESTLPDKTLQQLKEWNFISQYTAAQDMHAAIDKDGESPERLAALARAYANLGSLTECFKSPAHKVFKARALLYAERLTARSEDSLWALAHRAYARTFTGRHLSALADIETIRSVKKENAGKRPLPEWLDVIDAYCSYKPEVLDKATQNENTRKLALYLRALQTDPVLDPKQMLARTEELLKVEPACCRALDQLNDVESFGNLTNITETRQNQIWEEFYKKLQAGNLPESIKGPLDDHMSILFTLKTKLSFRKQITTQLKNSRAFTKYEPSINALGQLFQEVSYLHACRNLYCITAFRSISADDEIAELQPLLKGHPYGPYLQIYSSIPTDVKEAYRTLLDTYDPKELEISAGKLITDSYGYLKYEDYNTIKSAAVANLDRVYHDQLQHQRFLVKQRNYSRNLLGDIARRLLEISPHQPQTVALNIDANEGYADQHHTEIVKKYGDLPVILSAMAKRHLRELNDEKAEEILLRRLSLTADHETYNSLAELYLRRGELQKWLDTMQKALRVPTTGLENAQIRSKIANYYMGRGEWELAEPHAMKAARTGSSWGLLSGARCYEGLGKLGAAEKLMEARAKRYESNAAEWYFWCVRTNLGDQKSARLLAERMILENPYPNHYTRTMEIGFIHFMQGSGKEAFESFLTAFQKHNDGYSGLHAALLADELKLIRQRDELLKGVAALWSKDYASAELANYFQKMLQEKDPLDWNPDWFHSLLVQLPNGSPTNFYFFAGKFLKLRGQEELAETYLQQVASSPKTSKYTCALANQYLRALEKKIESPRITELEKDSEEVRLRAQKAFYLLQTKKREEAIQIFDEILKSKPELISVLMNRAQTYEGLGKYSAAIADYKKVIEIDSEYWLPYNNLAFIYAACEQDELRDGAQSLDHAQRAFDLQLTKYWVNYGALAVAYAELGQFDKAIEMQKEAMERAPDAQKVMAKRRLRLFNEGQPYRRTADKI